jgi:hypothetical protein
VSFGTCIEWIYVSDYWLWNVDSKIRFLREIDKSKVCRLHKARSQSVGVRLRCTLNHDLSCLPVCLTWPEVLLNILTVKSYQVDSVYNLKKRLNFVETSPRSSLPRVSSLERRAFASKRQKAETKSPLCCFCVQNFSCATSVSARLSALRRQICVFFFFCKIDPQHGYMQTETKIYMSVYWLLVLKLLKLAWILYCFLMRPLREVNKFNAPWANWIHPHVPSLKLLSRFRLYLLLTVYTSELSC